MLTRRERPLTLRRVLRAVRLRMGRVFSRRNRQRELQEAAPDSEAVRQALAGLERDLQELALVLRKLYGPDGESGARPPR